MNMMTNTPTQTPTQTPVQTPVQSQTHTPPQVDWGVLGAPPPPPTLIRQNACVNLFNVARRLDFDSDSSDSDDDGDDTGFPLSLAVDLLRERYEFTQE